MLILKDGRLGFSHHNIIYPSSLSLSSSSNDRFGVQFPVDATVEGHDGVVVGMVTRHGLDVPVIESRWWEILGTCPGLPCSPLILLHNPYRSFTVKKRLGRGINHPHVSSAAVEGREELYPDCPLGPSCHVKGQILHLT